MKLDKLFSFLYTAPVEEEIQVLRTKGRIAAKEAAALKKLSRSYITQARLLERSIANERRLRGNNGLRDRKAATPDTAKAEDRI